MKVVYVPQTPGTNDHLVALDAHFGRGDQAATAIRRDIRYVFLCFTNRCGSNFVANALGSSGHLNRAGEFFNADTIVDNCKEQGLASLSDYFNWLTCREGRNGYLVSKLATSHLEILCGAGILDQIFDISSFIMVERSDKLAQSISYDLARQTGRWAHDMAAVTDEACLDFSRRRLTGVIEAIVNQNREFSRFFAFNGVFPATIIYEQFEVDPAFHIRFLSRRLEIPELRYVAGAIDLRKQASPVNVDWRDRYLIEDHHFDDGASPPDPDGDDK